MALESQVEGGVFIQNKEKQKSGTFGVLTSAAEALSTKFTLDHLPLAAEPPDAIAD